MMASGSRRRAGPSRATTPPDGSAQVRRLEAEIAGLQRALRTRGLIEQAKGRLAERLGVDPEEAFHHLTTQSQQTNVAVVDLAADIMGVQTQAFDVDRPAGELLDWARREVRLRASVQAGNAPADLVAALAEQDWLGAVGVALFAAQTDGALLLLAAEGWPASVSSDWRWIPSAVRTPASEAIRRSEPIWLEKPGSFVLIGPGEVRVAIPILVEGTAAAALEVALPAGTVLDPLIRHQLSAAARAVGEWLDAATTGESPGPQSRPVEEAVIDAAVVPAAVLSPVWTESGSGGCATIEDFRIDRMNAVAVNAWRAVGSPEGRRLLDTDPAALHDGRFDACVRAYLAEPPPQQDVRCGAVRVGGRLLVTWDPTAESGSPPGRIGAMEDLGSFGWGEWSIAGEPLTWSAGLYRIVGRSAHRTPLNLARLLASIEPDDRGHAGAALVGVLRQGEPESVEVRLRRPDGDIRSVRIAAASRRDRDGRPRALVALFQDRTEARLGAEAAANTAERLATQRLQGAFERAQTEQLRLAFFPPPWTRCTQDHLAIVARHAAPTGIQSFRGDFYEIDQSEAGVSIAVGDVFGSGIAAAHTMVRLRYTARGLGLAGFPAAEVLGLLNRELCRDDQLPLASMVLAHVHPDGRTLTWAQAGHFSPILVRQGRARSLRRPRGDILGLTASVQYGRATAHLQVGDLLLLFTDGVFQGWPGEAAPVRRLAAECERAQREGGVQSLLDRLLPPAEDEACLVAIEWVPS